MKSTLRYRRNLGVFFLLTALVLYSLTPTVGKRYNRLPVSVPFVVERMGVTVAEFTAEGDFDYNILLESAPRLDGKDISDAHLMVEVMSQEQSVPQLIGRSVTVSDGYHLARFATKKGGVYRVRITPLSPPLEWRRQNPRMVVALSYEDYALSLHLPVILLVYPGVGFLLAGIFLLTRYGFSCSKAQ